MYNQCTKAHRQTDAHTHRRAHTMLTMASWTVSHTVQGCQPRREKESHGGRNAAVKTSFALCIMQKKWWQHKMVMTVKAFSHTLTGGTEKRRKKLILT